jgi:hypothetical protein
MTVHELGNFICKYGDECGVFTIENDKDVKEVTGASVWTREFPDEKPKRQVIMLNVAPIPDKDD